jgi:hypothetical protein
MLAAWMMVIANLPVRALQMNRSKAGLTGELQHSPCRAGFFQFPRGVGYARTDVRTTQE